MQVGLSTMTMIVNQTQFSTHALCTRHHDEVGETGVMGWVKTGVMGWVKNGCHGMGKNESHGMSENGCHAMSENGCQGKQTCRFHLTLGQ